MILFAAFIFGLLGSLHCLVMCGPIALSIPVPQSFNRLSAIIIYTIGRITTYAFLGLCVGMVGQLFAISGFQQVLSIVCGVLVACMSGFFAVKAGGKITSVINQYTGKVRVGFNQMLHKQGIVSYFLLGMVNGLLPCGLVYISLAAALATGSSLTGAAYMAMFGLGTAPAMLTVSQFASLIKIQKTVRVKTFISGVVFVTGVIMIVRGLNLGIPYLSPQLQSDKPACCHIKCH